MMMAVKDQLNCVVFNMCTMAQTIPSNIEVVNSCDFKLPKFFFVNFANKSKGNVVKE